MLQTSWPSVFSSLSPPLPPLQDTISPESLKQRWAGEGKPLFVTQEAAIWLEPVMGAAPAQIVERRALMGKLEGTPGALGILPFDELDPSFKVIKVGKGNPADNRFTVDGYPLAVQMVVTGGDRESIVSALSGAIEPVTNRDPDKLTNLIITGVTAMTRKTAWSMERNGYDYPARVIGPELRAADITHVSNEVPFIKVCKVKTETMKFCSKPEYRVSWRLISSTRRFVSRCLCPSR